MKSLHAKDYFWVGIYDKYYIYFEYGSFAMLNKRSVWWSNCDPVNAVHVVFCPLGYNYCPLTTATVPQIAAKVVFRNLGSVNQI